MANLLPGAAKVTEQVEERLSPIRAGRKFAQVLDAVGEAQDAGAFAKTRGEVLRRFLAGAVVVEDKDHFPDTLEELETLGANVCSKQRADRQVPADAGQVIEGALRHEHPVLSAHAFVAQDRLRQ